MKPCLQIPASWRNRANITRGIFGSLHCRGLAALNLLAVTAFGNKPWALAPPRARTVWRRVRTTLCFFARSKFIQEKMALTPLQNSSDTRVLLEACVSFDPSDASHKVVMRMMVVPMLESRLKQLHLAARVAPQSEPIQLAIREIVSELSTSSARLDGRLQPSASPNVCDPACKCD